MKKMTNINHFWGLVWEVVMDRLIYGKEPDDLRVDEMWKCYEEQFLK